jgi:hypothetical protein
MGIRIIGPSPDPVPDVVDIPAAKPKVVPHAADGHDNGWPSGDDSAGEGVVGEDGDPGFPGINNTDGGDTPENASFIIGDFVGTLEVEVRGGNGGSGGKGGPADGERAMQGDPGPSGASGADGSRNGTSGHLNIYVGMMP